MKKAIVLLLAAALILSMSASAFAANDAETDLTLLEDWANYLVLCERCYGDLLWALDYVEAYAEEPTWVGLNKACAAVCTAEAYLSNQYVPEYVTSEDTILEYLDKGLDLLNVPVSLAGSADMLEDALTDIHILKNGLCTEAFWQPTVQQLGKYAAALRDYCIVLLQNADRETNYILSVLNKEEYYDKMLAVRNEHFPEISKYGDEYLRDTKEIESRGAKLVDRLDECCVSLEKAVNMSSAVFNDMAVLIESGDAEAIDRKTLKLEGAVTMPMPYWDIDGQLTGTEDELEEARSGVFFPGSRCYYFHEENGERVYYKEKEEITAAPSGCVWTNIGVTKEGFSSYIKECEDLGLKASKIVEDGDAVKAYYLFEDHDAIVSWENGQASFYFLGSPVCFFSYY